MRLRRLTCLGASLLLGCNVGPKYEPPVMASPAGYLEAAVATTPGATPFTVIPAGPSSTARELIIPTRPALLAA